MKVVALHGLRGGTGATSLLAALGDALAEAGQRVLCIDLDPRNLLRLHFNHPWTDDRGWAAVGHDTQAWFDMAFACGAQLTFVPHGRCAAPGEACPAGPGDLDGGAWSDRLAQLDHHYYDWLLFDVPAGAPMACRQLRRLVALWLTVTHVDAACQALLAERPVGVNEYLLVNRYTPRSRLQKDLLATWQRQYADWLVPVSVHQDEALFDALAHKCSVIRHRRDSLAARDVQHLAAWLMQQRAAP